VNISRFSEVNEHRLSASMLLYFRKLLSTSTEAMGAYLKYTEFMDINSSLISVILNYSPVTYSGVLFTMKLYCTPRSQHTSVKHSRQLFEHTYTSNLSGTGTLIPIEFFQQDLLWQSSNTNSHSCSQKVSKHTSGQSIVWLSVHLHTTTV
jgi:hypothetical protein